MLLNEFRTRLTEYLVHFLWRQWAQLGLASAAVERRDGWVIDPEALWLLSGTFARHDARLFDEILDWLAKHSAFINVPRMRSLARRLNFRSVDAVGAMADVVAHTNSRLHWRFSLPGSNHPAESLFLDMAGTSQPDFGEPDPVFLRFGFKRGRVDLRGLSRRFNAVMPECALLRLRALFGTSARAEIALYLLTHEMAHPSLVARETGFSQKNIQDTLVDMCASGIVHAAHLEGRQKMYFMKKEHRGPFLHQIESAPRWVAWPALFRGLELLADGVARIAATDMSTLLQTSELRQLMSDTQPYFEMAGFTGPFSSLLLSPGEDVLTSLFSDLQKMLG